ncbi:MAG: alpha/beta hydrolase family protein, partial [Bacteroidales bacterium]
SIQMYTALKLLNKPVEMIQVDGEYHGIANFDKKIKWTKSILAWFDRYLKDQPEWWNELYPESNLE